jgi:hypothetical protein
MEHAWTQLSKYIKSDAEWEGLLVHVAWSRDAVLEVLEDNPRGQQREVARKIAKKAGELARLVETLWPGVPAFTLISRRRIPVRNTKSATVGVALRKLAKEADQFSRDFLKDVRLVDRKRGADWMAKAYVRAMALSFKGRYGEALYGTVAAIASVMLDRDITKPFVESAVRSFVRRGSQ